MDKSQDTTANADLMLTTTSSTQICSAQFFKFTNTQKQIFEFLFFGANLAARADQVQAIAQKALGDYSSPTSNDEDNYYNGPVFKKFKEFNWLISENMCIRLADNFACFLSDTVRICMHKKPELLRSSETVKLEDVLRFSNYRELLLFLVDRKINELSYGGIRELEQFFIDRTGIPLFLNDEERTITIIANELRNIYTHNRGIVNDVFIKRVKPLRTNYTFNIGERYHMNLDKLTEIANCMHKNALRIDFAVSKKFRTRRKQYLLWMKQEAL